MNNLKYSENNIKSFKLIDDCYIYFYHLGSDNEGEFVLLPSVPDGVSDTMSSTFNETNALSRTAPIFSYSNSGPRSVRVAFTLHRDMMQQVNIARSNLAIEDLGDDYIDSLIKKIQSVSLPNFNTTAKAVIPPMVAVRLGNEVFIKGVVNSPVSVSYNKPILNNGKYAVVEISFNISEVDPYDANTVAEKGSFRGMTKTNMLKLYREQ